MEHVQEQAARKDQYKVLTRKGIHALNEARWRRSQLTQEHLDFLVGPATLKSWSGLSLNERCVLFHRRFPEVKISRYYLRLAYQQAGIKKKAIRIKKQVSPQHQAKIHEEAAEALNGLEAARNEGERIVYLDELCTTKSTIQKSEWSARRHYPKTDVESYHSKTIATIATISEQKGVEYFQHYDKSVNQEKFCEFLKKLRQKFPFTPIALFKKFPYETFLLHLS